MSNQEDYYDERSYFETVLVYFPLRYNENSAQAAHKLRSKYFWYCGFNIAVR